MPHVQNPPPPFSNYTKVYKRVYMYYQISSLGYSARVGLCLSHSFYDSRHSVRYPSSNLLLSDVSKDLPARCLNNHLKRTSLRGCTPTTTSTTFKISSNSHHLLESNITFTTLGIFSKYP